MWHVSFNLSLLMIAGTVLSVSLCYFALAHWGFRRAWDEFRLLRHERLARASGLLSPALESARLDPFRHFSEEWVRGSVIFSSLGRPKVCPRQEQRAAHVDPLFHAIQGWEDHHHSVSHSFFEALGHVAHHRLVPHADFHERVEPIGETLLKLVDQCDDPSLQKELRLAYSGLKTGAEQNLDYISRRMRQTAQESHAAFNQALGHAQSELGRLREAMIQSICRDAEEAIEKFLETHHGFRLNPVRWGRQTAYYREFEQLRDELRSAHRTGDLSQIALIVIMIVEDENRFVVHLHAAVRSHDELHQRLSQELHKAANDLNVEAHTLSGWASQENQRLQSSVSHQLILHLERWQEMESEATGGKVPDLRVAAWIIELSKLRDQDPELAAQVA